MREPVLPATASARPIRSGRVTSYTYTTDGLLQTYTDPRGLVTTYNYDTQGNVASMVASDGGISTMQYDVLNRLTTQIDPIGRTTTYAYDAGGQPNGHDGCDRRGTPRLSTIPAFCKRSWTRLATGRPTRMAATATN